MIRIPVKYIQPIDSLFIKLQDGTTVHWFDSELLIVDTGEGDFNIEWVDGKPYKVSVIEKKDQTNE